MGREWMLFEFGGDWASDLHTRGLLTAPSQADSAVLDAIDRGLITLAPGECASTNEDCAEVSAGFMCFYRSLCA